MGPGFSRMCRVASTSMVGEARWDRPSACLPRPSGRAFLVRPHIRRDESRPLDFGLLVGHASACQPVCEPAFSTLGEFLGLGATTLAVHEAGETLPREIMPVPDARGGEPGLRGQAKACPTKTACSSIAPKWPKATGRDESRPRRQSACATVLPAE
jgi:hypothetical protein